MKKIKTNTLRIKADTPEQANLLAVDGIKLLIDKLKSEKRMIKKYILSCHFNRRDAAITDKVGDVYKKLIDIAEGVMGFEAQEVMLTVSKDLGSDFEKTYTIDIIFFLH